MRKMNQMTLVALAAILFACTPSKKEEEKKEVAVEPTASEEMKSPPTVVMVTHTVDDFDTWYQAYSSADSLRATGGFNNETVHRGIEDPSLVVYTAYSKGHDSAREYFGREELKAKMKEAGVNQEPEFSFWDLMWNRGEYEYPMFEGIMFVRHDVKAADVWLDKFHAHDSVRMSNGIYAIATGTLENSPNHVGIYLGVTNVESANAMLGDPEMKKVMDEAGVTSEPVVLMAKMIAE